jgi:hypothetical protein
MTALFWKWREYQDGHTTSSLAGSPVEGCANGLVLLALSRALERRPGSGLITIYQFGDFRSASIMLLESSKEYCGGGKAGKAGGNAF